MRPIPIIAAVLILLTPAYSKIISNPQITGQLKTFHKITITFDGPATAETAQPNPFTNCRLEVNFSKDGKHYTVPGYFAADGNAAQTSAKAGNKWRVHFTPDSPGKWEYSAIFAQGKDIFLYELDAGKPFASGTFTVKPTDKTANDFRAKGILQHVGKRYLQFSGSKEYFLKAGADSPENFLAFHEFDNTFDTEGLKRDGEAKGEKFLHEYKAHIKDFRPSDPTWQDGKGKAIIGALNYLASKGVNSIYFITYNLDGGDGKDVWPWINPNTRDRFDCSKLDQWEIVFSHMDSLGIMLHVLTQETENDQALDGGDLDRTRKLYYRELIARFAHHPALVWNLGEENTNTTAQQKAFAAYFKQTDPYKHPVVAHTYPGKYDEIYTPLLGYKNFDGASLQMNQTGSDTHSETLKWLQRSAQKDHQWFVCLDEFGHGRNGVKTDDLDPAHDEPRKNCLWPNLFAGGAGVEWYFGYEFPHNDLNCEDFRSRDRMWDLTRYAIDFFHEHLPFAEMQSADDLTTAQDDHCLAKQGQVYAIYLPNGGTTKINLGNKTDTFIVKWYNPQSGGQLLDGSIESITGPSTVPIGTPPNHPDSDWVVLIKKAD
jgi:hypothetical protein